MNITIQLSGCLCIICKGYSSVFTGKNWVKIVETNCDLLSVDPSKSQSNLVWSCSVSPLALVADVVVLVLLFLVSTASSCQGFVS
jgi:hypothetical protein